MTVQPGLPYNQLNEFLNKHGFHFGVEAGWGASIGGMVATNASGAGATDAGSMGRNVLGCEVVVNKNGYASKITTGTKAPKSSSGYNLTSLFVGSEGTLGAITKVTLKIRKNFLCQKTVSCQFSDLNKAVQFVIAMKGKVNFRRVELMDKLQTKACILYSNIDSLAIDENTLLIEFAGNSKAVTEEIELISKHAKNYDVTRISYFENVKTAETIWMMRKNACNAAIQLLGSKKKAIATDVSVPMSQLSKCISACYHHMENFGLSAPLVAHVGDGNFHFTILADPKNLEELDKAKQFNIKVVEEALKVGGTCTGEHGIGLGKISHLESEHGDSIFLMQAIKNSFDPNNIFNPGKVFRKNKKILGNSDSSSFFCSASNDTSQSLIRSKI